MIVYISGPIAGKPNGNRDAFQKAADLVRLAGHDPMNPQDLDHSHPLQEECSGDAVPRLRGERPERREGVEHRYGCYMRADLLALIQKADAILTLHDWQFSRGAKVEVAVADICGIPRVKLRNATEDEPFADPVWEVVEVPRTSALFPHLELKVSDG